MRKTIAATSAAALLATATFASASTVPSDLTVDRVADFKAAWGEGIVNIGSVYSAGGDYEAAARDHILDFYAYGKEQVLFKPTLAAEQPFRPDLEGTLSYFVSGNSKYAEDKGFALQPWSNVRFDNHTVNKQGNIAIAMGHYYFTGPDGTETKVEYTKGYVKTEDDRVLIFLQDSSLPYSP